MATLEEIQAMWEKDSDLDRSQLGVEALVGPKLHHKYWKLFSAERMRLKRDSAALKKFAHKKFVFYSQGPTRETEALGWKLPPCGKILKGEAREYVDCDDDVVALTLAVAEQAEKVEFLESIIKNLKERGFAVKNAMDWEKFLNGQ
jgi:hypothetical protein